MIPRARRFPLRTYTRPAEFVETTRDAFGEYVTRWKCAPPARGVPFKVLTETWSATFTSRTIYAISLDLGPSAPSVRPLPVSQGEPNAHS